MWYRLRTAQHDDLDFASSVIELLQPTSRNIILAMTGLYLAWQIIIPLSQPDLGWRSAAVTLVAIPACALALLLLHRRFLAAQVIWLSGFAAAQTLAIYIFQEPVIAFSYALLPLMAVITVGWPAALLAEGVVIALAWWLRSGWIMPPIPASYAIGAVVGGVCTALLGWAATQALLTVTRWSLFSYNRAREKMEDARSQRAELKQTQQDLLLANRELARLSDRLAAMHQVDEEARRTKEEFVANVSHELRTPLNMIIGFSEMILQSAQVYGARLPPALLSDVGAIERNSRHLARLVDDVLDLSQIEAGRMALSREWASPQEIVEAAVVAVRSLFASKGLYLEAEIAPDLPAVYCDATRMRQVVINLLSNAGRFTERGGVRARAWREKADIVISVADTGPGIARTDQERIFEPFRQLDGSTRRRHGGTGLGLSISKRFVEMHGGRMWVESDVGAGATFCLSLPLQAFAPAPPAGDGTKRWFSAYDEYDYKARTRRSKAPAPALSPRYVVLEQEGTLQRLFGRYLDGAEIVAVQDIDEAIREVSRSPAQALVVNAPPAALAGGAPAGRLARLPYGTPALICWLPSADEAVKRLGVVRYLVKPVTRVALLSTLSGLSQEVKRVLLVDDDREALQLFSRMLYTADRDYHILRAETGPQALSLLRQRRPDVMLLDLIMPGMDGFQVLEEKSQDPSIQDIPVVVVSSRDPSGQPIVTSSLSVTRSGGLSVRDLLACIQATSRILAPSVQTSRREL
jgi:signal transduction histidine kinase/CheY-like chemotaxis protein